VRLPETDSLELPDDDSSAIDRSEHPAPDDATVLAMLPGWARRGDSLVRAAVVRAIRRVAELLWARQVRLLMAAASPRFAEREDLDELGRRRRRPRVLGESDTAYRERLLARSARLTPVAITNALRSLVERPQPAPIALEIDEAGAFCAPVGADWGTPLQSVSARDWAFDPEDPPRIGGVYVVPANPGPWLLLVAPGTIAAQGHAAPVGVDSGSEDVALASIADTDGMFVGPTSELFDQAVAEVEARRAGGVIVFGIVDPLLSSARLP